MGDPKGRRDDLQEATSIQSRRRGFPNSIPDATIHHPKKKSKPTAKSLRHSLDGSDHFSCDCSRATHVVRGRAILTIESSGQKPADYFTFVPDSGPLLTQTLPADTSGKQRPYTSDKNALLVGMPWAQIAAHFPGRSPSSLQDYATRQPLELKSYDDADEWHQTRQRPGQSRSSGRRLTSISSPFALPTMDPQRCSPAVWNSRQNTTLIESSERDWY
jgi:hypothetical protein